MYEKQAVGERLYLWTIGGKMCASKSVIISAHGEQALISSSHTPPRNITLHFYGPHGSILEAPAVSEIINGNTGEYKQENGADAQDYVLSKFQGAKHGNADESYENIAAWGKSAEELVKDYPGFTLQQMQESVAKRRVMDIITIRNRRLKTDVTMREVIWIMEKNGHHYEHYHCSFCRGGRNPFKKDPVHAVKSNPLS